MLGVTTLISKLYYRSTVFFPRPLPKTEKDFEKLKDIFTKYYNIKDEPHIWYTICAHIQSTPATEYTKSYAKLLIPAKRLDINSMVESRKRFYSEKHNEIMKAKLAKEFEIVEAEEKMKVKSDNIQGVVDVPSGSGVFDESLSAKN